MSRQVQKPFYFNPPWNILFELNRIRKIKPWDINISFLLNSFLEEMEKSGQIDFRASGVAVDSSSTIYLMKSKLLLKLEEPPEPPPKVQSDFLPPPLSLPFRYELTSTTIHHLLQVLDEVLKGEHVFALKPRVEPVLPPPSEILPPVDIYMMQIEKQMGKLHRLLLRFSRESMPVLFSKVVAGLKQLEAIKTFIVLLFLAQKGDVNLWQDPELNDIYITLGGGPTFERPAVGVV
jgi:chromatin segregation and condensation protein Rec8/ScpA/Scc1 (kleisin family)